MNTQRWEYTQEMLEQALRLPAAFIVLITSVFIASASRSVFSRKSAFWLSLVISSSVHLVTAHAWIQRVGDLSRSQGKLAALLGFVLFFAVYGLVRLLQRNFYGEEARDNTSRER